MASKRSVSANFSSQPLDYQNYVDGAFTGIADNYVDVFNPATGDLLGRVPDASEADIDHAVKAARKALSSWEKRPAIERAQYLRQISAKIREHRIELADVIIKEQGKTAGLAQVEVDFTADYIDYMAEWARRLEGEILTSDRPNETMLLLRKPIGVVAGILPWNFPFFLIARKLAPHSLREIRLSSSPAKKRPSTPSSLRSSWPKPICPQVCSTW